MPGQKESIVTDTILRSRDQLTVAVVLAALLSTMIGSWCFHGGHRGRLVDIDRAGPVKRDFRLDINHADWPEWTLLPGIGETLARRIVASRRRDGPFRNHDDLTRVRGIGPRTLQRIRPYLAPPA